MICVAFASSWRKVSEAIKARALSTVSAPYIGQATKSAWRIPWRQQPMKDAINCEKLGGAVIGFDP